MKMEKPTVEAVRFQNSDVIATSGGGTPVGAFSLSTRTGDNYYGCLRTEAEQAGMNYYENRPGDQFVSFHYNPSSTTSVFDMSETNEYLYSSDHYAWYSNGQWWTENKAAGDYGYDRSSTANWRTN